MFQARELADEALPVIVDACKNEPHSLFEYIKYLVEARGWRVFQAGLAMASEEVRVKILAAVMAILPASLKIEFIEAAIEPDGG